METNEVASTLSKNGHPLLVVERVTTDDVDVAVVAFNRPAQRNPVDKNTIAALSETITELAKPGGPRGLILTGSGGSFSAGGDLKGYQSLYRDPEAFRVFIGKFNAVCDLLETSRLITVAMVNGTCVAGGLELALSCDFVTIADTARIGDGHLKFGQLPGAGGSQRLVRALGVQRARQWLLTARLFSAEVAVEAGLAFFSSPEDELRARTVELVSEISRHTPLGFQRMKSLISIAENSHLGNGIAQETELVNEYATQSHDALEGLDAFAERRVANYLGT